MINKAARADTGRCASAYSLPAQKRQALTGCKRNAADRLFRMIPINACAGKNGPNAVGHPGTS